jgi:rhomboid protease GluP
MIVYALFPGLNIDNYAHLGGFVGGYAVSVLMDPLKPERVDHIVIALGCIAASLLAVVWSAIDTVQILR